MTKRGHFFKQRVDYVFEEVPGAVVAKIIVWCQCSRNHERPRCLTGLNVAVKFGMYTGKIMCYSGYLWHVIFKEMMNK